jgi:type II secretory pathway component PulJ
MVGMIVAMVVIAGAFAAYMAMTISSRDSIRADRLNQDMQTVMDLMVADLRRAGYWNSEATGAPATNPFSTIDTATAGCILYSYDVDGSGQISDNERFGFKLSGNAILSRTTGTSLINCDDGTWDALTDNVVVNVSTLTFTAENKCVNGRTKEENADCEVLKTDPDTTVGDELSERRSVRIALEANPVGDTATTKALEAVAQVRNDRRIIVTP